MKFTAFLIAGIAAGLTILLGEAILNFGLLDADWAAIFQRFDLPQPTPAVAAQGVIKLMVLGWFTVWLAGVIDARGVNGPRAGVQAGLVVWFLVWAWVQWGMLLAGYVTPRIAALTVVWGLFELPLAGWAGAKVYERMAGRAQLA